MTNRLDAVAVSDLIRQTYLRYLRTLLPVRDQPLNEAIRDTLSRGDELVKGPLLESNPPYAHGATLKELIQEGVLSPWMERVGHDQGVPLDRPLYRHQEHAVRRVVAGRNVVVATGTGSGKTESFMLPILEHLAQEDQQATLGEPGVRALLLYPMNALANDQLKRLRELLAPVPEVTFGRYTGETLQDADKAAQEFARRHPGQQQLPNELLSRDEIQQNPPHLLLTNYAMLEYLLLRPRDTSLFDGPTGKHWRFIVMDEAHVYDGASGIEVAMLLRRLRDRVAQGRSLISIATSATVGGTDAGPQVAEFAETLMAAPFAYDLDNPDEQDVVWAERERDVDIEPWGPLPPGAYRQLVEADDLAAALAAHRPVDDDPVLLLGAESRLRRASQLLADQPTPLPDIAKELFGDEPKAVTWTGDLIALGAGTRKHTGAPLLPARYHLWARATEGCFACLNPEGPHVHLTRHEVCAHCGLASFEVGSCKRCAATYLVGTITRVGTTDRFGPPDAGARLTWLVLPDRDIPMDVAGRVDEDEATLEQLDIDPDDYEVRSLCVACGQLGDDADRCDCGGQARAVLQVQHGGKTLLTCGLCGGRSNAGQIRRLTSGTDASVAVLSTALYQALPPDPAPERAEKPGGGRKLLFFADSRQDAAYFAPYLEDSYRELVRRRVVYAALEQASRMDPSPTLDDVAYLAAKVAGEYGVFSWRASGAEKRRTALTWIHGEVISTSGSVSLEGLGLVAFDLMRPPRLAMPAPLLDLGLDDDEAWALIKELLRTLRSQGAVTFPEEVAPDDDVFQPRTGPIYARLEGPEPKRKVLSFLPGRGQNGRVDYLRRVLADLGHQGDPTDLAKGAWRMLTEALGPDDRPLQQFNVQGLGVVSALDHRLITARLVTEEHPIYRCSRCQRLAPVSVRSLCTTIGCTGRLEPWSAGPIDGDDHHYRSLARQLNAVPLESSEHTAQLSNEAAAETQQRFLDGDLNALSCSTTFELGVDVGELQSVVLRNVPPTTANYVQRAGRAGRRTDSAALALTYAQQRSHDLTYFRDPSRMISGKVRPPRVSIRNHRIAQRHVQAVALAAYFREAMDSREQDYRTAEHLFGDNEEDQQLIGWLTAVPDEVVAAARRVVPEELHGLVGLDNGSWVTTMIDLVRMVGDRYRHDIHTYRELEQQAVAEEQYKLASVYQRVINTFQRRHLLGVLAGHNLLPKYGFPIDSVDLRTSHVGTPEANRVELSRDLRLAISDYAPGSQVVAGGYLWESAGVYRMPDREFPRRYYAVCRCGWFTQALTPIQVDVCPACGASGKRAPRGRTYIKPEFGFLVARKPPERPRQRPLRVYSNSVHLAETDDTEVTDEILELSPGVAVHYRYVERGELVVINAGHNDQGYRLCDWCGAGEPARPGQRGTSEHSNPLTGRDCRGSWKWLDLGHAFETDVLELRFDGLYAPMGADVWWGMLFALVEAAADTLQISRDDIDGTLRIGAMGTPTLVMYDDVPAGAGHAGRVRDQLGHVIRAASDRVDVCECGPETSCYRCLRGFRNQRMHDRLRRGAVANLLGMALGVAPAEGADDGWLPTAIGELEIHDGQRVRVEHADGTSRTGTLWVETDKGQIVSCMLQTDGGIVDLDVDEVAGLLRQAP